jgi:hypothetical protein
MGHEGARHGESGEREREPEQAAAQSMNSGRVPLSQDAFEKVARTQTTAQYAKVHKPFSPLPKGEGVPPMSELWAHAMRRYGRFQGYAWGGVLATGAVAYGLAMLTKKTPPPKSEKRLC